jgi:hypothetical protein
MCSGGIGGFVAAEGQVETFAKTPFMSGKMPVTWVECPRVHRELTLVI